MERASEVLQRSKISGLEFLQKFVEDPCTKGCNGRWLQCGEQILLWNDVSREAFSEAVINLLEKGRGKHSSKGSCKHRKTFLSNPLNIIYSSFCIPATSNFALVGAEKAEVIFKRL